MANSPPPAKRGRPRVDEPGSAVSCWLRKDEADQVRQFARDRQVTVSEAIRLLLPRLRRPR